MTKDQLGHIDALHLVHLHGNTIPVVVDTDRVPLHINIHLDRVHGRIPLLVVGGVDEDLVEDLVEARHVGNRAVDEAIGGVFVDPEGLGVLLDGADVGVGPKEDVLQLGLLLVRLLDGLLPGGRIQVVGGGGLEGLLLRLGTGGRHGEGSGGAAAAGKGGGRGRRNGGRANRKRRRTSGILNFEFGRGEI